MHDREFLQANQVFQGIIKNLRRSGLDVTKHKSSISKPDFEKMYSSKVLSNDDPISLQRKVFVEMGLHFARRGREGLRKLKKTDFDVKNDANGREYDTIKHNEYEKNHTGLDSKETEKKNK